MTEIRITKPFYRWLFGGVGFHNSEATMTKMMKPQFLNERVLKSYREICPTFSRLFAGYANWTKEAMDAFADYYAKTFQYADTTMYLVPGRIPLHETAQERLTHCEDAADRLEYLIRQRGCRHIRYYCVTNELSVGNTYAYLAEHRDVFIEYQRNLWRAFKKRGLDILLAATDCSGLSNFNQIAWAAENIDDITGVYCAHNYDTEGKKAGDLGYYPLLLNAFAKPVEEAWRKEKRFMLGEFGIHDSTFFNSKVMRSDVFAGFGDPAKEADSALMAVEEVLAAMNAGVLCTAYWTFCDYPNPFLKDWSETPSGQAAYETGRFSGHGVDIRYNKNGLFRWDDDENDYSSRPYLYTVGLMAKYFRRGSRVMAWESEDPTLRCGAVTNPDRSFSLAILNWDGKEKETRIEIGHTLHKSLRKYTCEAANVPYNPFNDLQPFDDVLSPASDGSVRVLLPARSLTVLTTDYEDRITPHARNIRIEEGKLAWDPVDDPDHRYYRVFEDGKQIASTVGVDLSGRIYRENAVYETLSVDRFGNCGQPKVL